MPINSCGLLLYHKQRAIILMRVKSEVEKKNCIQFLRNTAKIGSIKTTIWWIEYEKMQPSGGRQSHATHKTRNAFYTGENAWEYQVCVCVFTCLQNICGTAAAATTQATFNSIGNFNCKTLNNIQKSSYFRTNLYMAVPRVSCWLLLLLLLLLSLLLASSLLKCHSM